MAVGRLAPSSNPSIDPCRVSSGYGFAKYNSETIEEYISDVERLSELIRGNAIDVILAHPFYSLFPAVAAAKISEVPIVYFFHGSISSSFVSSVFEQALFMLDLSTSVDYAFSVQTRIKDAFSDYLPIDVIRNPVALDKEEDLAIGSVENKRWALCSRLDEGKLRSVKSLLRWLPCLDIDYLDIYGDGAGRESLMELAESLSCECEIVWHSYNSEWLSEAKRHCCGVIGFGRVAIEALAANLPVILLNSNGNPYGVVDKELLKKSIGVNFSSPDVFCINDPERLNSQLMTLYEDPSPFLFGREVRQSYSLQHIADELLRVSQKLSDGNCYRNVAEWGTFLEQAREIECKDAPYLSEPRFFRKLWDVFDLSVFQPNVRLSFYSAIGNLDTLALHAESSARDADIERKCSSLEAIAINANSRASSCFNEISELNNGFKSLEDRLLAAAIEIQDASLELRSLKKELASFRASHSWRIGRAVTALPRLLKKTLRRKND